MRINRTLLGWGLFFIVLGGVFLAVRQGFVSTDQVSRAWTLWPLLLIFGGLGLILRRTPIEALASLATAVTFGLIAGGVLAGGGIPFGSCGDDSDAQPFTARTGELPPDAEVEVSLLCGEMELRTADGTGWSVSGADEDPAGPPIEATGNRLRIGGGRAASIDSGRASWTVVLPRASRMDFETTVNAGSARLALDGARLQRVKLTVNAGDTRVNLAGAGEVGGLEVQVNAGSLRLALPGVSVSGSIHVNAGSVALCPQSGVGLRLTSRGVLSSNDFGESGLVQLGDAWETAGFAQAPVKVELTVQANAGSVELESEGSCDA